MQPCWLSFEGGGNGLSNVIVGCHANVIHPCTCFFKFMGVFSHEVEMNDIGCLVYHRLVLVRPCMIYLREITEAQCTYWVSNCVSFTLWSTSLPMASIYRRGRKRQLIENSIAWVYNATTASEGAHATPLRQ